MDIDNDGYEEAAAERAFGTLVWVVVIGVVGLLVAAASAIGWIAYWALG